MRERYVLIVAAASLAIGSLNLIGCDRTEKGTGDSHSAESGTNAAPGRQGAASNAQTGLGGNGNAATTSGAGATNGVSGNETNNAITAPGNTPTGAGITTRPATQPSPSQSGAPGQ